MTLCLLFLTTFTSCHLKSLSFHAYVCNRFSPAQYRVIKHGDLINPFPLHARTIDGLTHDGQYAVVLNMLFVFCDLFVIIIINLIKKVGVLETKWACMHCV